MLWCCWLGGRKGIRPVKNWVMGCWHGLERGADLHMSQRMPLPLTVSRFSKVQIGFTFLVLFHPGGPEQRAVKRVCDKFSYIWVLGELWLFRFRFVTSGTLSVIINLACGVGQIQAGWAQHDYGHLSVFRSSRWNHRVQIFLLNFIKVLFCAKWMQHFVVVLQDIGKQPLKSMWNIGFLQTFG